ncbi:hypothetical protein MRX96_020856 [Rhipicephalus microplus]
MSAVRCPFPEHCVTSEAEPTSVASWFITACGKTPTPRTSLSLFFKARTVLRSPYLASKRRSILSGRHFEDGAAVWLDWLLDAVVQSRGRSWADRVRSAAHDRREQVQATCFPQT